MSDGIEDFQVMGADAPAIKAVVKLPNVHGQNRACDCCQECQDSRCGTQCHNDCSCDGH